ncbi:hypothetical protein J1N35_008238, partial [Gossypium stocksii]
LKSYSSNHIGVEVEECDERLRWRLTGDFNEIMYTFEKVRGVSRDERRMEAFRGELMDCKLIDVGYSRVWFT